MNEIEKKNVTEQPFPILKQEYFVVFYVRNKTEIYFKTE